MPMAQYKGWPGRWSPEVQIAADPLALVDDDADLFWRDDTAGNRRAVDRLDQVDAGKPERDGAQQRADPGEGNWQNPVPYKQHLLPSKPTITAATVGRIVEGGNAVRVTVRATATNRMLAINTFVRGRELSCAALHSTHRVIPRYGDWSAEGGERFWRPRPFLD